MPGSHDPDEPRPFEWTTAKPLTEFLAGIVPLDADQRRTIIAQAKAMLGGYYVHLPFKMEHLDIDPLGDLDRLAANLPAATDDVGFHTAMSRIFAETRDLHTQYSLPAPYQATAALLPFKLGAYVENDKTHIIVTDMLASYRVPSDNQDFGIGSQVLSWCGVAIDDAVNHFADMSGGASDAARRARALASMTLLPMERQPPPTGNDATLTYRAADGRSEGELTVPWRVIDVSLEATDPALGRFTALDHEGEVRRHASTHAYRPEVVAAVKRAGRGGRHTPDSSGGTLATSMPSVFKAQQIDGTDCGYIRIFSFHPPTANATMQELLRDFVEEFGRLIAQLPQNGLVVDVRGNGGGFLPLAEGLLQTLTPNPITPQPLELLYTPEVLALCRASVEFGQFVESLTQAAGAPQPAYSKGFPLTPPEWCNWLGWRYPGPVILVIDARCYSATDAFAAGFQDHAIGKVLGVSPTTGAGGANVWTLPQFLSVPVGAPIQSLPNEASLRVALRRTRRVGINADKLVEGFGVAADIQHTISRADLLDGDRDLLARAVQELGSPLPPGVMHP